MTHGQNVRTNLGVLCFVNKIPIWRKAHDLCPLYYNLLSPGVILDLWFLINIMRSETDLDSLTKAIEKISTVNGAHCFFFNRHSFINL